MLDCSTAENGVILEGRWSGVFVVRFLVRGKAMLWLEMGQ